MSGPRIWPLRLAASEGVAAARTGRWTSALIVVVVAWLCALPGALDAVNVSGLVATERDWIEAGGHVYVVTSREIGVPAGVCERLSGSDAVEDSFALVRTQARGGFAATPGADVSLFAVSPGAYDFLGLDVPAGVGVIMSGALSERSGVGDGEPVVVLQHADQQRVGADSGVVTASVADTMILGEEYDGALLVPASLGNTLADACFVRTDAEHVGAVGEVLPGLLAVGGTDATVSPRLFTGEFSLDFTTAYGDRALRWAWVAAAAVMGLIWALVQWFRRGQTAIYATFGMRAAPRMAMQVAEWGTLAGIGMVWGVGLGVVGALALGASWRQALPIVVAHSLASVLAATVLVVLLGTRGAGSLLSALKDR